MGMGSPIPASDHSSQTLARKKNAGGGVRSVKQEEGEETKKVSGFS